MAVYQPQFPVAEMILRSSQSLGEELQIPLAKRYPRLREADRHKVIIELAQNAIGHSLFGVLGALSLEHSSRQDDKRVLILSRKPEWHFKGPVEQGLVRSLGLARQSPSSSRAMAQLAADFCDWAESGQTPEEALFRFSPGPQGELYMICVPMKRLEKLS